MFTDAHTNHVHYYLHRYFQVGTELIRGISGGQKKRTSIGMELIISPDIIFLDEPTTGLDATTAVSVARLLKEYVHNIM